MSTIVSVHSYRGGTGKSNLLTDGFRTLIKMLQLDYLFIDTHPGLNEETLLSIIISEVLMPFPTRPFPSLLLSFIDGWVATAMDAIC